MEPVVQSLLENSRLAIFAAIEMHNKPILAYRYQLATISLINAWELLLKGFIAAKLPEVKLVYDDGTTKQFEECLACVKSTLGKNFILESESIDNLYFYRCTYIHFYEDQIDTILYSLFAKNVELYNRFLLDQFGIDISNESSLILLPIGFKPPVTPIEFLSKKSALNESSREVQTFIEKILTSTTTLAENGVDESIFTTFNIALINTQRTTNADIIAAIAKEDQLETIRVAKVLPASRITNDPDAQAVRVEEQSLYHDIYTENYQKVVNTAKEKFPGLILNKDFHEIMNAIKNNPQLYKVRYLDVEQTSGTGGKGYFSPNVYDELAKHYSETSESKET